MDISETTRAKKGAETWLGLPAWSLVVFWLGIQSLFVLPANAGDYYVAPDGADTNPGTQEKPLATLEGARNAIRKLKQTAGLPKGGVVVELLGGVYELAEPLKLSQEDSGEEGSPIVYRARQGEEVRLLGGRVVTQWRPVTDSAVLEKLDPSARGKVFQTDLKAQGMTDFPTIEAPGWAHSDPGVELFYRDKRMTLARWPNEGYTKIADLVVQDGYNIRGRVGSRVGKFVYEGDRPKRWLDEKEVWLHGYWWVDWAEQRMRVQEIDPEKKQITLAPKPTHQFGFRKGQWYYALNLLCELDRPGEWYLDRDAGVLYFWPPNPIRDGDTMISSTKGLATLDNVSHVTLAGLTFEAGRGTAVTVTGGEDCAVLGCVIRNMGGWGVRVSGGNGHRVAGCDLYDLGEGGIFLNGGERSTLTHADHVADNNHIHHCSRWNPVYHPGIALRGVGQRASHNLLHDLPHIAIGFTHNEHCIEYNEMHNVVYQSNDAGAIYTYGPSETWTMRGHVIRYNYLHDIRGFEGRGCQGVYLDDCFSSVHLYGNLFERVYRAAFIGGGRDNIYEKNLFVDCDISLHVDARGLGWAAHIEPALKKDLASFPISTPPWSTRYPQLQTLLENDPMAPVGNIVRSNVSVGGRWDGIHNAARKYVTLENNLVDEDPHFVNADKGDYRLRPDSPAFDLGFEPIPYEKIGCYQSPDRASWPVGNTFRDKADDAQEAEVTKEQRLEWFRQAKFGMFIHWGPYARLAGAWQGKQLPVGTNCEWIMEKFHIPREEYREAARKFNPVKFDADAWTDLAATTGVKYVVLTAKHHDGFAMYHSRVSKYNIVDYTPFDRDPLKELADACRKRQLQFCIYYSHREDWDEPFAYGNTWDFDFKPEDNLDLFEKRYLETKAKPQLEELLTEYGPFGLVWFDRGMYTPEQGREFAQLVWKHQPHCLVNGRVGNYNQELLGDYQNMNDNGMPIGGIEEYWETPQTLNETWGYSAFDHQWKRPEEIIRRLVEIVSRGGNYLLNIGPDGEGTVPEPSVRILRAVGKWVSANGESIYGTTASPFHELPWGYCTVKDKTLYLHVFDWPADRCLKLPGLRTAAQSAALLADPATQLPLRQENGSLEITLPDKPLAPVNTVVAVNLEAAPRVDPPVVSQAEDGTILLDYIRAITSGRTVKRFNRKGKFHISKWTTPEDTIVWHLDVTKPGRFDVKITYAADAAWSGQPYVVQLGQSQLKAEVQPTGASYEYKTLPLGTIQIDQPGRVQLSIRPAKKLDNDLMYFKSLELTPQ